MTRRGAIIASLLCITGSRVGAKQVVNGKTVWLRIEIPDTRMVLPETAKTSNERLVEWKEGDIVALVRGKDPYDYALEVWYKDEKIRLTAEEIMAALRH